MIDILRCVAANAAIDAPVRVKPTDIDTVLPSDPPDDFAAGYALANVFANLAALLKVDRRETSLAINRRFANSNSAC
jgi:hypothetical protein